MLVPGSDFTLLIICEERFSSTEFWRRLRAARFLESLDLIQRQYAWEG